MRTHSKQPFPLLAITMGDPAGIGPEIVVKAFTLPNVRNVCRPVIIGSLPVFTRTIQDLNANTNLRPVSQEFFFSAPHSFPKNSLFILDPIGKSLGRFSKGKPGKIPGKASESCIRAAVQLALQGSVSGIVTAPINKESLHLAGCPFPGHTEFLGHLTKTKEFGMMLLGGPFKIVFVTTHVSIRSLPRLLTIERVQGAIVLAQRAMQKYFGVQNPRIGVAALNPHGGEHGLFGDEEIRVIRPAISLARRKGMKLLGPLPADTMFGKAVRGDFDVIVAMYHDQGLIPLKTVAFGECVNLTIGLPILRTSVDHGTAYDIAGQNMASPHSLIQAIHLAARLAGNIPPS